MAVIRVSSVIARPPADVFALIADIGHYGRWLSPSGVYTETANISDDPIRVGTTYVDHTTFELRGEVLSFEPPTLIVFHQATVKPRLDAHIRYDLEPVAAGTSLTRTTTLTFAGMLRLIAPLAARQIGTENRRTIAAMKEYLER